MSELDNDRQFYMWRAKRLRKAATRKAASRFRTLLSRWLICECRERDALRKNRLLKTPSR